MSIAAVTAHSCVRLSTTQVAATVHRPDSMTVLIRVVRPCMVNVFNNELEKAGKLEVLSFRQQTL